MGKPQKSSSNYADGTWHHVAATFDGEIGEMKLYVDGQFRTTLNTAVGRLGGVMPGRGFVGAFAANASDPNNLSLNLQTELFDGDMDDVRYWNVVRTPEQIAANFEELQGDKEGLEFWYNFDNEDLSDFRITDASGNGNVGRLSDLTQVGEQAPVLMGAETLTLSLTYQPEILAYHNYYPFGWELQGDNMNFDGEDYRYGFQAQETDKETGLVNYKYRMHDPRIGRFFAVDPLAAEYPYNGPYNFSENRVIDGVELEGLEYVGAFTFGDEQIWGEAFLKKVTDADHINIAAPAGGGDYAAFEQALIDATNKDNEGIGFLAIFAHGAILKNPTTGQNETAMFANDDLNPSAGNVYSSDLTQLQAAISNGTVKFADDAVIYIGSCNCGTESNGESLAQAMADATEVKVIAIKDTKMAALDYNDPDNTTFIPYNKYTGQIHVFEKGKTPVKYDGNGLKVDVATLATTTMTQVKATIQANNSTTTSTTTGTTTGGNTTTPNTNNP